MHYRTWSTESMQKNTHYNFNDITQQLENKSQNSYRNSDDHKNFLSRKSNTWASQYSIWNYITVLKSQGNKNTMEYTILSYFGWCYLMSHTCILI